MQAAAAALAPSREADARNWLARLAKNRRERGGRRSRPRSKRSCTASASAKASSGPSSREREPGATGTDEVSFLIRPNPGLPFAPVAETASGGELSRIALAIAAVGGGETMVFDEIDAGIGGETAHAVGETLRRLAERAQVITITHLPQIATVADRHFSVQKIPGDPTHTPNRAAGRGRQAGGGPPYARGPGVPANGAMTTLRTFVEHTGPARLDRRTKNLARRLSPDDIAIIDHADLDRVSAEELIESGVRVVVNVAPSQTGRFPNPGPLAARARRACA